MLALRDLEVAREARESVDEVRADRRVADERAARVQPHERRERGLPHEAVVPARGESARREGGGGAAEPVSCFVRARDAPRDAERVAAFAPAVLLRPLRRELVDPLEPAEPERPVLVGGRDLDAVDRDRVAVLALEQFLDRDVEVRLQPDVGVRVDDPARAARRLGRERALRALEHVAEQREPALAHVEPVHLVQVVRVPRERRERRERALVAPTRGSSSNSAVSSRTRSRRARPRARARAPSPRRSPPARCARACARPCPSRASG